MHFDFFIYLLSLDCSFYLSHNMPACVFVIAVYENTVQEITPPVVGAPRDISLFPLLHGPLEGPVPFSPATVFPVALV